MIDTNEQIDNKTLIEKLENSYDDIARNGGYYRYKGNIKLDVQERGIAVLDDDGFIWNKGELLELADEIRKYAESVNQERINQYNNMLTKRRDLYRKKHEEELQELDNRRKERALPKSGWVILFRSYSSESGNYKFNYTTSLSLEQKVHHIKRKHNNMVDIIHFIKTDDTKRFFYQFIQKHFLNRLVDGTTNEYQLTYEDIVYLKAENYTPDAMNWINGKIQKG